MTDTDKNTSCKYRMLKLHSRVANLFVELNERMIMTRMTLAKYVKADKKQITQCIP